MERRTLTLKTRPSPESQPKVDPAKTALSEQLGIRFVMRDHRYICQKLVVSYDLLIGTDENGDEAAPERAEISRTWIDVPLVPEAYCG